MCSGKPAFTFAIGNRRSIIDRLESATLLCQTVAALSVAIPKPYGSVQLQHRELNAQPGRVILQDVGNRVFWVSILLIGRQPQPVPSSSKIWLPEIGPSEAMYIGWKN
jgi:hypothetical protein